MWFLTHEGIDRYNGKEFKRYKLMDGDKELDVYKRQIYSFEAGSLFDRP